MICDYLEPVVVHPDRYGSTRPMPPKWVVVHTSEQRYETASAARDLATFMTSPGDRATSSGGRYGSSYHDVVDLDYVVRPAVPHDRVSFSAPGSNTEGVHVCLPATASQDAAGWRDDFSRRQIGTLAGYLLDTGARHGIPIGRAPLTVEQLRAGVPGFTDHYRIGVAFKRTNHTDVGVSFPWDLLAEALDDLEHPTTPDPTPEEGDPEMSGIIAIYQPDMTLVAAGHDKSFALLPGGDVRHATGPDTALGRPVVPIAGLEHYRQCEALDAVWRSNR